MTAYVYDALQFYINVGLMAAAAFNGVWAIVPIFVFGMAYWALMFDHDAREDTPGPGWSP